MTVESQTVETPARINKEVFAAYAGQLRDAARNAQLNYAGIGWDSAALQAIMRLPEVVSTEAESISDEEHAALVAATEAAVAQLDAFRLQEGTILIADLLSRVDKIEGYNRRSCLSKSPHGDGQGRRWKTSKSCRSTSTATGWSRR